MDKYLIGSTSNLLSDNNIWNLLKEQVDLKFLNYGDILSGLVSDKGNAVIITIFFEDFIENSFGDYSLVSRSSDAFLDLVKKRSLESDSPIIICLCTRANSSAISSARYETKTKAFYNDFLAKIIAVRDASRTVYFLNMMDIFYKSGSDQMFSDRNWYFARCRLSAQGLGVLAASISEIIGRIRNPSKKVLVLDCDNTLWGGVIGEDGLQGLILGQDGHGQAFMDFQKECLRLSNEGVILALASKNNEEDVWNVFENHPSMILKREHVSCSRINWNEKSSNLLEMAAELGLGIDSFVFWDDNPIERSKVQTILPEVTTVDAPNHVIYWPSLIRNLNCFSKFEITTEDLKKSRQYKARAEFVSGAKRAEDIKSYLKSINLLPKKISLCDANLLRAEQMCQKTNQFNLRTKRFTASELQAQSLDPNIDMFLVSLTDDYGDHGIVALAALKCFSGNIYFIDTFLMSCRVLGRYLEAWILNEVLAFARQRGAEKVLVDFIESGKNSIAKEFLVNYGFNYVGDSGHLSITSNDVSNYVVEGELYEIPVANIDIPNIEIYEGENNESS